MLWAAALGAVFVLFSIFHRVGEDSTWLYRGGFLVVSAASAAIVALACHPAISFGRLLATQPMRYIGERSYGLYLYHWPIFVVTRPGIDLPFDGVPPGSCGWPSRSGLPNCPTATWRSRSGTARCRRRGIAGGSRGGHCQCQVAAAVAAAAGLVFATGAALAAIPAPNASDYLGGRTEVGQDLTAEPAAA